MKHSKKRKSHTEFSEMNAKMRNAVVNCATEESRRVTPSKVLSEINFPRFSITLTSEPPQESPITFSTSVKSDTRGMVEVKWASPPDAITAAYRIRPVTPFLWYTTPASIHSNIRVGASFLFDPGEEEYKALWSSVTCPIQDPRADAVESETITSKISAAEWNIARFNGEAPEHPEYFNWVNAQLKVHKCKISDLGIEQVDNHYF